jgi:branched-chain amino acid transport system substrate-binding protein
MPGGKAFEAKYVAAYHHSIELHAPFAYDATATLVEVVEKRIRPRLPS